MDKLDTELELVSVCMPVRNGVQSIERAVKSVLAQDHKKLELVICDNASTDGTSEFCEALAATDNRVIYHRHSSNLGLLNNFIKAMHLANGNFFRWLGDDDWLPPNSLSRCLEVFASDSRLILVTSRVQYIKPDGTSRLAPYHDSGMMSSDDPLQRLEEYISYLVGNMPVDPLYSLMRRTDVAAIRRRNMLKEDEVFSVKLALAGPWGHVPEVLLHRHLKHNRLPAIARLLDVPRWQAYFSGTLECREILRAVRASELASSDRRRAYGAIAKLYVRSHQIRLARQARKLFHLVLNA